MDKKSIISTSSLVTDKNKEKIFFGEYSGFQRYDNPTYQFAIDMEERQRNAFWNPNEISMNDDSQQFFELPEHIQEIMIRIWLFQTLMDSGQNSGLENVLAEICTNSEFEAMFKTWGYFELIHSLSYSHILRGIFADSTKIFDRIKDYPEIQQRINKEVDLYNKVKNIKSIESELERKKLIVELLINIFALEGVKFYVSFLVTYIINNSYDNKINGSTRIIKLINFDEDFHTNMASGLLNILKTEQSEGYSELMESEWYHEMVKNTFKQVFDDEMQWTDYLLSIGDIPTLTKPVIKQFLQHFIDLRLNQIKEPVIFNQNHTDVTRWFTSGQESDLAVYSIGIMKNDLPDGKIEI